jgi:hypothetical protein
MEVQGVFSRLRVCALVLVALSAGGTAYAQSAQSLSNSQSQPLTLLRSVHFDVFIPQFTRYEDKRSALIDYGQQYTELLLRNVANYGPWVFKKGTQVHMGFWSGPGNRGNLVRLLGSINNAPDKYNPQASRCTDGPSSDCALWDEGFAESEQYPAYLEMLVEHWYERNSAIGKPLVSIYGELYRNKNPLPSLPDDPSVAAANIIWGQYSRRYADMARTFFRATGKPVNAWCFVKGARPDRIFFQHERPELQILEAEGAVNVYCTKNPDAEWNNNVSVDWTFGTNSANCLPPTLLQALPPEPVTVFNRK